MKIGILTLPLSYNYGGILQAYALQTVLERMGHEVWHIQPYPYHCITLLFPLKVVKRIFENFLLGRETDIFSEIHHNKKYKLVNQYTRPFVKKQIHLREVNRLSDIRPDEFDSIVVGSDQIWRPHYFKGLFREKKIENAFLGFTKKWKVKRIAYAASFGTDIWEYSKEETIKCKSAISMFTAVSVREDSGAKLCSDYLGVSDVPRLLDPTLLLERKDYEALLHSFTSFHPEGNMMCYILDESKEKQDVINLVSKDKSLKPFKANVNVETKQSKTNNYVQPPLEHWLLSIINSELIVTDSFHACVFSIIFNKPFIVLENKNRGLSRITSLLEVFGLHDHLVKNTTEYCPTRDYFCHISEEVWKEEKQKAIYFLTKALK